MKTKNLDKGKFFPFDVTGFELSTDFINSRESKRLIKQTHAALCNFANYVSNNEYTEITTDVFNEFINSLTYNESTVHKYKNAIRLFSRYINDRNAPKIEQNTESNSLPVISQITLKISLESANNWSVLINRFLAYNMVSELSQKAYEYEIKKFLAFCDYNATEPNADILTIYINENLEKCSVATTDLRLSILRSFFNYLRDNNYYQLDATRIKIHKKREYGFKRDIIPISKVLEILELTQNNKRDFAIFSLLFVCGLRACEVVRINFEDITKQVDGAPLLRVHGKGREGKNEFVLLPENVVNALNDYINTLTPVEGEPIFTNYGRRNHGGRLTTRTLERIVNNYLTLVGVKSARVTLHSCRHTAVTLCLLNGATLREAQLLARHKNLSTTAIYSHNIDQYKNRAFELNSNAIFEKFNNNDYAEK